MWTCEGIWACEVLPWSLKYAVLLIPPASLPSTQQEHETHSTQQWVHCRPRNLLTGRAFRTLHSCSHPITEVSDSPLLWFCHGEFLSSLSTLVSSLPIQYDLSLPSAFSSWCSMAVVKQIYPVLTFPVSPSLHHFHLLSQFFSLSGHTC